jgi:hypothetical protein
MPKDGAMQHLVAFAVVAGYYAAQWFVLTHSVEAGMRDIVLRSLGMLDAALVYVLGFYFGATNQKGG